MLHCRCVARQRPGSLGFNIILASKRQTLTVLLANNKGADEHAHLCSLINAFAIRYLKSELTTSDINFFSFLMGFSMIKSLATPLQCLMFPYDNPANHAPGAQTDHSWVHGGHFLRKAHKKVYKKIL